MHHVILLRAISNARMAPFREKLERLGFENVESFGATGNFLVAASGPVAKLEARVTNAFGTQAILRTRPQLQRVAEADPHAGEPRGAVTFLQRAPTPAKARAFRSLDLEGDPHLEGRELYYRWPLTRKGRKSPLDIEKELEVVGTLRTSRVVAKLAERIASR